MFTISEQNYPTIPFTIALSGPCSSPTVVWSAQSGGTYVEQVQVLYTAVGTCTVRATDAYGQTTNAGVAITWPALNPGAGNVAGSSAASMLLDSSAPSGDPATATPLATSTRTATCYVPRSRMPARSRPTTGRRSSREHRTRSRQPTLTAREIPRRARPSRDRHQARPWGLRLQPPARPRLPLQPRRQRAPQLRHRDRLPHLQRPRRARRVLWARRLTACSRRNAAVECAAIPNVVRRSGQHFWPDGSTNTTWDCNDAYTFCHIFVSTRRSHQTAL